MKIPNIRTEYSIFLREICDADRLKLVEFVLYANLVAQCRCLTVLS